MSLQATTSQTVGPFFEVGLEWLNIADLAAVGVAGDRVTIQGHLLDGDNEPVPDAFLEIWQANAHGKYLHPEDWQDKPVEPGFLGFGRVPTNLKGFFQFTTIKPGPVQGPNGMEQAPHLVISIFMRGLLKRLVTRMYFPDEAGNTADPILNLVEPVRRRTLIAQATIAQAADSPGTLEWNVSLQGANETVFFDLGL